LLPPGYEALGPRRRRHRTRYRWGNRPRNRTEDVRSHPQCDSARCRRARRENGGGASAEPERAEDTDQETNAPLSASGNNHVDKNRQQPSSQRFGVGDEVAYALGRGMRYGRVVRVLGAGDTATVEIEFEDGGREVHKMRDRALSLLRRATGESARDEE